MYMILDLKVHVEIVHYNGRLQIEEFRSTTIYPLDWTNSLLLKIAIEIIDLPIKHGDFP